MGSAGARTPALEMRGITKSFGGQRALDGVDLTVRAGEIHGVLGENGAGKSTLMNVLAGVVRPDVGAVTVAGQPLRLGSPLDSAAHGVGMVHQHFSLIPALTVAENLSLAAGSGPVFYRQSTRLAIAALAIAERLGWHFDPKTPVWQLPIGRQQRLEILKTLQRDARWLLFDEPTAVLSPPESEELFEVLEQLRGEGRGIVFISHKLGEVLHLCDRITVLRRGRWVGERARGVIAEELARLMVGDSGVRAFRVPAARADSGAQTKLIQHQNTPVPALVVRDLRVRDDRGAEAVRGLAFEVQRGEIFGIAGVDGNGQAELAEAVVGLRPVTGGEVKRGGRQADVPETSSRTPNTESTRFAGTRTPGTSPPARPGYIPQDRRRSGLVLPMSVRENLALEIHAAPQFRWGPWMRLSRLWAETHAMARRFDVRGADERQPAATLSGGNQQKIVIARALSGERALLVAVNPTRGLDVGATGYVHEQLRAARAAGVGVLLISTELDEVLALSDRVGILYAGRFQGIVAPTESRDRIGQMMGGVGGGTS